MEHKLIQGGEQWLPFARSRIKALKALGGKYATQRFTMPDGATVMVQLVDGIERIEIKGGGGAISYVADVAYPMTLENKFKIFDDKVTVRTGRAPNYGVQKGSVSPFSNKHIAFKSENRIAGFLEIVINDAVVATATFPYYLTSWPHFAASASDAAAVLVTAGKSSDIYDSDLTAYMPEFVLDGAGEKVLGVDGEPTLTHKVVPFASLTNHTGGDNLRAVIAPNGNLYVITQTGTTSGTDFDTYIFAASVYTGALPTETVTGFLDLLGTGFPPEIFSVAVEGKKLYVLCRTNVNPKTAPTTLLRYQCVVYTIETAPFRLTYLKTVVMEENDGTGVLRDRYAGGATCVNGIIWTARRCINTNTAETMVVDNPVWVAPSYIDVAVGGKKATYYWTFLSAANIALNGIPVPADPNYLGTPFTWPSITGPVTFADGSRSVFNLVRSDVGVPSVVDVTPVPEADWKIMPTRWDRGSVLNNYGAALQFAKPAGTK